MKTLIAYYSLTGNARVVADALAAEIGAAVAEIHCSRYRPGVWGEILAAWDNRGDYRPKIDAPVPRVEDFDRVILGGPVWVGRPAAPLRSFIGDAAPRLPLTAFFLTHGGSPADAAFAEMQALAKQAPLARMAVLNADLKTGGLSGKLHDFVAELEAAEARPAPALVAE